MTDCESLEKIAIAAAFSVDAYNYSSQLDPWIKERGWESYKDYSLGDKSPTGYFGRAYVNEKIEKVFIAHQGTENKLKDYFDLLSVKGENPLKKLLENQSLKDIGITDLTIGITGVNPQSAESILFSNSVMQDLQNDGLGHFSITQTGHSLGGGNGGICGALFGQKVVTFDSYGYKTQLDVYKRLGILSEDSYEEAVKNSVNYGASGGVVNFVFDHFTSDFGGQWEVDDIKEHSSKKFAEYFKGLYEDCIRKRENRYASSASIFAARVGDNHICPAYNGDTPHRGGPIADGSPDVLINGKRAARSTDTLRCDGVGQTTDKIAGGSKTVLINGKPAARIGEKTTHGGVIADFGSIDVLIGD